MFVSVARATLLLSVLSAPVWADDQAKLARPFQPGERSVSSSPLTLEQVFQRGERRWSSRMKEAAKNLKRDTELVSVLRQEAAKHKGISLLLLQRVVAMESKADRKTGKNRFGFAGLFQMGKMACKDVGVRYEDLDEPREWRQNAAAGAKFLALTNWRLRLFLKKRHGITTARPTAFHLYLAHQQGATGCARLMAHVLSGAARTRIADANMISNLKINLPFYRELIRDGHRVRELEFYAYMLGAYAAVTRAVR